MLHTKFGGNWPAGFRRVFTIYGHGGHLGHVTSIIINFHFHPPKSLHNK